MELRGSSLPTLTAATDRRHILFTQSYYWQSRQRLFFNLFVVLLLAFHPSLNPPCFSHLNLLDKTGVVTHQLAEIGAMREEILLNLPDLPHLPYLYNLKKTNRL
jgi:hypothetical protein